MCNSLVIGPSSSCGIHIGTQILASAVIPQLLDHLKFYGIVLDHKFLVVYIHQTKV